MCRWLAYSGSPIRIDDLLYKPEHSLIDQSLHSKLGAETTNGDGFGIGWYDQEGTPGVYRCIEPAWNDRNLRDLSGHIRSPIVFAHIGRQSGPSCSRRTAIRSAAAVPGPDGQGKARPRARRRSLSLGIDRGVDRHRAPFLPRADVRARGRSAGGGRSRRRADRRHRRQA